MIERGQEPGHGRFFQKLADMTRPRSEVGGLSFDSTALKWRV
jgi:hypothetical protein